MPPEITDKPQPDPIADWLFTDVYMRWALQATEQIVGQGMKSLLQHGGLERFIDNYPSTETKLSNVTFRDYANLNAALLNNYGSSGRSTALRIGRRSARLGIEQNDTVFNLSLTTAAKLLPYPAQLRFGMDMMQAMYRRTLAQGWDARVEDRANTLAYITQHCPMCAGKQAKRPICWIFIGVLQEGILWMTGKLFDIEQTECRAVGDPQCVWEVSKTPVQ